MDTVSPASSLTITADLTSTGGRIDLSASYTSITLNGAILSASGYTGNGAAIDLSGTSALTFGSGVVVLNVGSGNNILLPPISKISGTIPSDINLIGNLSYAVDPIVNCSYISGPGTINTSPLTRDFCYNGGITISSTLSSLEIVSATVWSEDHDIDFSAFRGDLTLNGAMLRSDDCRNLSCDDIDLRNVASLILKGTNILETDGITPSGDIFLPSGFRISGSASSVTITTGAMGGPTYSRETGNSQINFNTVSFSRHYEWKYYRC